MDGLDWGRFRNRPPRPAYFIPDELDTTDLEKRACAILERALLSSSFVLVDTATFTVWYSWEINNNNKKIRSFRVKILFGKWFERYYKERRQMYR